MTETLLAVLASSDLVITGAILSYIMRVEHRLTRIETILETKKDDS